MQPMSDKDLDQLFQQRFETFEIEPSTAVWNKITDKLDDKKANKKFFSGFWAVAASVIIAIGIGLWFYKPLKVVKLHGKADKLITVQKPLIIEPGFKAELKIVPEKQVKLSVQNYSKSKGRELKKNFQLATVKQENRLNTTGIVKELSLENNPSLIAKQVGKDPAADKIKIEEATPVDAKPSLLAKTEENEPQSSAKKKVSRKRIRSIGGLINFVITKVDRREDKIIEFSDDNEGSKVSAINLGLVKFKSRNEQKHTGQ